MTVNNKGSQLLSVIVEPPKILKIYETELCFYVDGYKQDLGENSQEYRLYFLKNNYPDIDKIFKYLKERFYY